MQEDIVALNTWADRKVTPSLRPGVVPGTIDVDLIVEDSLPLHGSIELNNRYSPDTTPLRFNASISYGNLWQLGHTLGLSTQIAPERIEDAEIFSAFYLARFARNPDLSLLFNATKQNSDVSTLGGAAVAGRGEIAGCASSTPCRDAAITSIPSAPGSTSSALTRTLRSTRTPSSHPSNTGR